MVVAKVVLVVSALVVDSAVVDVVDVDAVVVVVEWPVLDMTLVVVVGISDVLT